MLYFHLWQINEIEIKIHSDLRNNQVIVQRVHMGRNATGRVLKIPSSVFNYVQCGGKFRVHMQKCGASWQFCCCIRCSAI